ncbi:hypothetical protein D3C83_100830 [compost metagenome]
MRNPHGRQAEVVGEDVVRQRAAQVRQDRRGLVAGFLERILHPDDPGVLRVETRRREEAFARRGDFHHRETGIGKMLLQR